MTSKFAGKYDRYPDLTKQRQAEGGRRLSGASHESRPTAPLVTIITVCFNSAATIAQTFRSVSNQTYDNIEYIVVDGGSSDGTVDILKSHEDMIDYYVSEPDNGLYYAMNKGIELAKGEYILILNSDDWYENEAVKMLVDAKFHSQCDFVGSLASYVDEENGKAETLRSMPFNESAYFRMPLRHETMLIPASLYERLGPYDTDFKIIADREYTARLFETGASYHEVPRALLNFRITGVSNTNLKQLLYEKTLLLHKEFPFLSDLEIARLNDPIKSTANDFADIANKHLDQPKFVKAISALLRDRQLHGGKRWQSNAVNKIGKADPVTRPKVSVIVAVYNAQETLRQCIDSVLSQSLKEIELICVNDQTPDDSQAIIDDYARCDKRVISITNKKNIGLGASRNRGIAAARGKYIFHLDPDDSLPPGALKSIHALAERYGSDMTRGAYTHEQLLLGKSTSRKERKGLKEGAAHIVNTTLAQSPEYLKSTEGHWSYLYRTEFAKRVKYPEDLKMGQDSIFIVNAVIQAKSISITDALVYHYRANPSSAMNTFNFRKFMDALEWRIRAWTVLNKAGFNEAGEHLLFRYWSPAFFQSLTKKLSVEEKQIFDQKLSQAMESAGYPSSKPAKNEYIRQYIETALRNFSHNDSSMLQVATFSTLDFGGAGIGSQRRVKALRKAGINAEIHCFFKKTDYAYVHKILMDTNLSEDAEKAAWRSVAVLTREEHPDLKARELFSKTGSIVDFKNTKTIFDKADIVHMHWVVGIFDYSQTEVLINKPVTWTLADMNAFTGGCHYSEGCTNYQDDCRNCPLLGEGTDLAHETWKVKRDAYAKIPNLHIICPSEWLANCARESNLFKNRPIHVIPNALPIDKFTPTNKLVARSRLGLPLDKKLIVFGADSLANCRKGGDILCESIKHLGDKINLEDIEGVFFGSSNLNLGIKTHNMGHVSDERKLSLIYAAADVFAFPSREDNAPLTVPEALLSGTPVVAFPVGNVPELIKHFHNGFIAQSEDPEHFAEGLAWILKDTRSRESLMRGMRCHLAARKYHDPESSAKRHIALYRKMLKGA